MRPTRVVGWLVVIELAVASVAHAQVDPGTSEPRVELGVGLAGVRIRELPPREHVGQGVLSLSASGGYLWTPYLLTQVDVTSQVERFGWDYEHVRLVTPSRSTSLTLAHGYRASRWAVAQLVLFGRARVQPYAGAGVAVESQTTEDSWYESGVILGPGAREVSDTPQARPDKEKHTVVFGEVGVKLFVTRRTALLVDWRFSPGDSNGSGMFGLSLRLP